MTNSVLTTIARTICELESKENLTLFERSALAGLRDTLAKYSNNI